MSVKRDSQNSVKNRTISAINSGGGGGSVASTSYQIRYLAVGGGGGGGYGGASPKINAGGGGGGGGVLQSQALINVGTPYTIVVGAGGAGIPSTTPARGNNGANTTICGTGLSVIAYGGGAGGGGGLSAPCYAQPGGSGGGGSYYTRYGCGVPGQGNPGVTYGSTCTPQGGYTIAPTVPLCNAGAAGGGGAGSPGFFVPYHGTLSPSNIGGGQGGFGITSDISGTVTWYSCGGGGSGGSNSAAANTGYGLSIYGTGGAGRVPPTYAPPTNRSLSGNSGIVIISYISPTQKGTGGTVTSYSPPTSPSTVVQVHTFASSGTFTYTG